MVTIIKEYTYEFSEVSRLHSVVPEYNLRTLELQELWANAKLKAQGYLFLNEVLDMLGLPKTARGQLAGWLAKNGEDSTIRYDVDTVPQNFTDAVFITFNPQDDIIDEAFK